MPEIGRENRNFSEFPQREETFIREAPPLGSMGGREHSAYYEGFLKTLHVRKKGMSRRRNEISPSEE